MLTGTLIAAVLPALAAAAFAAAEKQPAFAGLSRTARQAAVGLVYAGIALGCALLSPAWQTSCAAAAPLAAGLLFGAPAGLVSGGAGALLVYVLVPAGYAHGARAAAILLAGLIAALVRRELLDNRRPRLGYALLVPCVAVVLQLCLVFFSNAAAADIYGTVLAGAPSLLAVCCGSTLLACLAARAAELRGLPLRRPLIRPREQRSIYQTFQFWLFVILFFALVLMGGFIWFMQTTATKSAVDDLLATNLQDMQAAVAEADGQDRSRIEKIACNRHIWEKGFFLVCDRDGVIVSDRDGRTGQRVTLLDGTDYRQNTTYRSKAYGMDCYWAYTAQGGYFIVALLPVSEAMFARDAGVSLMLLAEILVFALLFAQVTITVKKVVVEKIHSINTSLEKITGGNLDERADVNFCREFSELSAHINQTVDTLKQYIAEAAARIDQELDVARQIQRSALPSVFPPYPNRPEFSIYAGTTPAREVGGDFYDFYLLDGDRLAFLIADVSGKGIPAAMFMMTAKALLKSSAESGLPVEQVFATTNDKLCAGNDAGMFVTAWMGVLELSTGLLHYANAGHNPPLLCRGDGGFEYLRVKPNFVLAGMEGVPFRSHTLQLHPGDTLFLYTDGVTEAHDTAQHLYGEGRLLACLESSRGLDVQALCEAVKSDVDVYAGQREQFDDITLLCLRLTPRQEAVWSAELSEQSIADAVEFVKHKLKSFGVTGKSVPRLAVVTDDVWCNIVRYSHAHHAEMRLTRLDKQITLAFRDDGIAYNPLQAPNPDVTLPAEEREPGGLGILIMRKLMNKVDYQYKDGLNCLTLTLLL